MYKTTQDNSDHQRRVGSHSTKGDARGFVDTPSPLTDWVRPIGPNSGLLKEMMDERTKLVVRRGEIMARAVMLADCHEKRALMAAKWKIETRLHVVNDSISGIKATLSVTHNDSVFLQAAGEMLAVDDYNRFITRVVALLSASEYADPGPAIRLANSKRLAKKGDGALAA